MVKVTRRDLEIIALALGGIDFYLEGALQAPVSRALKSAWAKAKPAAARGAMAGARAIGSTAVRGLGTAAIIGKQVALRHPVLTGGAVVYYTYKNRDELGGLIEQGYEVLQDFGDITRSKFEEGIRPITGLGFPKMPKKRMTSFNKAVKKGMSIVKGSTSYGKKGTINNAKKAFSAVTKVASAASNQRKMPKSGITRKIYLGIKGLFK